MTNNQYATTRTKGEERILEILCDFATGLEAAALDIKRQIAEFVNSDNPSAWNPDKIKWEQSQGSKGPYERSEDVNNPEFKLMLKDLSAHQGKLSRDDIFYWTFQNESTVGRKKRQK